MDTVFTYNYNDMSTNIDANYARNKTRAYTLKEAPKHYQPRRKVTGKTLVYLHVEKEGAVTCVSTVLTFDTAVSVLRDMHRCRLEGMGSTLRAAMERKTEVEFEFGIGDQAQFSGFITTNF